MKDWHRLPPLSALRAFSAYAETGSVTRAGALLNVSHAAISQQMRNLETHLGLALLDRSGRALALTPEGQQLADALAEVSMAPLPVPLVANIPAQPVTDPAGQGDRHLRRAGPQGDTVRRQVHHDVSFVGPVARPGQQAEFLHPL